MKIVIKPILQAPRVHESMCLSDAALETLAALKKKYQVFNNNSNFFSSHDNDNNLNNRSNYNNNSNPFTFGNGFERSTTGQHELEFQHTPKRQDAADYYKNIYKSSFKMEIQSQPQKYFEQCRAPSSPYPGSVGFDNRKYSTLPHEQSPVDISRFKETMSQVKQRAINTMHQNGKENHNFDYLRCRNGNKEKSPPMDLSFDDDFLTIVELDDECTMNNTNKNECINTNQNEKSTGIIDTIGHLNVRSIENPLPSVIEEQCNRDKQRVDEEFDKASFNDENGNGHIQSDSTTEKLQMEDPLCDLRDALQGKSEGKTKPNSPEITEKRNGLKSNTLETTETRNGLKRNKTTVESKPSKKLKSGFKAPTKQNTILDYVETASKENNVSKYVQEETAAIVDFLSLTSDLQDKALDEIKASSWIALTVVHSNGKALINAFQPVGNITEDSSISIMALTANFTYYQMSVELETYKETEKVMKQIFYNQGSELIITNSKELFSLLYKKIGVKFDQDSCIERLDDPLIASWLLNPDSPPKSFSMMCQTARLKFTSVDTNWIQCLQFTPKLMSSLKKRLKEENITKLYRNIEVPLIPLLAWMENQSIRIDIDVFRNFAEILKNKLHKLEESAFKLVGHKFLINSHPQLRQILYEELKLDEKLPPKSKIGKTNVAHHKSTSESSLLLLCELHPLPSVILEYRTLQKMKSTYIDGMMSCVNNNSITSHWDQISAATGRLTSNHPNIQNVPKTAVVVDDYLPNSILGSAPQSSAKIYAREPFIPHDGYIFLSADFQQIEFRILAHLSNNKALLSMFWNPDSLDVFSLLTAEWKNMEIDSITCADREMTKRLVYSVMYGVGKDKLAEHLKVQPEEAKQIMQNFLTQYPAIDSFTKKCCAYAKEYGYTETICGRRRYFPYINSSSLALRSQAQRQAINFCIQGSAADICKLAMLEVESSLKKFPWLDSRLLIQIHDELLWEVKEEQLLEVKKIVEEVMENTKTLCDSFCSLQVPLAVSFYKGKSWAHLTPMNSD